jgi:phage shock protein PspC (stress-responsive transcriptional regulator)
MDKTININVGGSLFQIDDEAFHILRDWLQELNKRFRNVQGGLETIEDIELRVAEIFNSQKGIAGVITKENVEAMISIIGKPEDFDHSESEHTEQQSYKSYRRRLYRNPDDSIISGVCGGLGAYLNTDPVIFRILFAVSALVFGSGFLIYIVLWIALPPAHTEVQKRELFGSDYYSRSGSRASGGNYAGETGSYSSGYGSASGVGNAFNEIFRAIGRVFYIIMRIFLIIFGITFVITGFLSLITFVAIFVFRYPGVFSIDSSGVNMYYLPDLLNYIVSPSVVPWIIILTSVAVILPLLALIYWGVKMIFWFKARDGILSLAALVIWVASIAVLSIILFNEGTSFAQTAKISAETSFANHPDTIYIVTDHKISDLKYDKEVGFPHEGYRVYMNDEKRELYIRPYLSVGSSEDNVSRVEVRKRTAGRTEIDAMKKTEGLQYNYSIGHDTLYLDEYFTIPDGRRWSADNVRINLDVPVGTVLKIDKNFNMLFNSRFHDAFDDYPRTFHYGLDYGSWVLTEDGLRPAERERSMHR